MVDCKIFSEQRQKCHAVYGKGGEECLHQELSEKRCLSLYYCKRQAIEYYGDFPMTNDTYRYRDGNMDTTEGGRHHDVNPLTNKGLCASWAESFAYSSEKELEYGDDVVRHHLQARDIVSRDRTLKQDCRQIAFALAQCLREKKIF